MWPYGYSENAYPENDAELKYLAYEAILALGVIHILHHRCTRGRVVSEISR